MFEDSNSELTDVSYDLPDKKMNLFTSTDINFNTKLSAPMFNVFSSHATTSRKLLPSVHGNKIDDLWEPDYDKNYKVFKNKDVLNIASSERAKRERLRLSKKKDYEMKTRAAAGFNSSAQSSIKYDKNYNSSSEYDEAKYYSIIQSTQPDAVRKDHYAIVKANKTYTMPKLDIKTSRSMVNMKSSTSMLPVNPPETHNDQDKLNGITEKDPKQQNVDEIIQKEEFENYIYNKFQCNNKYIPNYPYDTHNKVRHDDNHLSSQEKNSMLKSNNTYRRGNMNTDYTSNPENKSLAQMLVGSQEYPVFINRMQEEQTRGGTIMNNISKINNMRNEYRSELFNYQNSKPAEDFPLEYFQNNVNYIKDLKNSSKVALESQMIYDQKNSLIHEKSHTARTEHTPKPGYLLSSTYDERLITDVNLGDISEIKDDACNRELNARKYFTLQQDKLLKSLKQEEGSDIKTNLICHLDQAKNSNAERNLEKRRTHFNFTGHTLPVKPNKKALSRMGDQKNVYNSVQNSSTLSTKFTKENSTFKKSPLEKRSVKDFEFENDAEDETDLEQQLAKLEVRAQEASNLELRKENLSEIYEEEYELQKQRSILSETEDQSPSFRSPAGKHSQKATSIYKGISRKNSETNFSAYSQTKYMKEMSVNQIKTVKDYNLSPIKEIEDAVIQNSETKNKINFQKQLKNIDTEGYHSTQKVRKSFTDLDVGKYNSQTVSKTPVEKGSLFFSQTTKKENDLNKKYNHCSLENMDEGIVTPIKLNQANAEKISHYSASPGMFKINEDSIRMKQLKAIPNGTRSILKGTVKTNEPDQRDNSKAQDITNKKVKLQTEESTKGKKDYQGYNTNKLERKNTHDQNHTVISSASQKKKKIENAQENEAKQKSTLSRSQSFQKSLKTRKVLLHFAEQRKLTSPNHSDEENIYDDGTPKSCIYYKKVANCLQNSSIVKTIFLTGKKKEFEIDSKIMRIAEVTVQNFVRSFIAFEKFHSYKKHLSLKLIYLIELYMTKFKHIAKGILFDASELIFPFVNENYLLMIIYINIVTNIDPNRFTNFGEITKKDFLKFMEEYGKEDLEKSVLHFLSFGTLLPKAMIINDLPLFLEELNNLERYIRAENLVRLLPLIKIDSKKICYEKFRICSLQKRRFNRYKHEKSRWCIKYI